MDYDAYAPEETSETTPAALPGLPARTVQVLFSPGELFPRLRERPVWVGALVLGAVLVIISTLLIPPELFVEVLRRQSIEAGRDVPAFFESGGNLLRMFGVVFGAIGWFLVAALIAGFVTLIFGFMLGDEVRYVQYLSVVSHSFLVAALGGLLLTPLRVITRDIELRLTIGTFASFLPDGYFLRVLSQLDLFGLWAWVLVGVGIAAMNPKRSLGSAVSIVMIIPVVMAAVIAIFS